MSLVDELRKLSDLKASGALTEEEFEQAKSQLLRESTEDKGLLSEVEKHDGSLGQAANRYVSYQIVMGVIGFIIFLIMLFTVFLPHMSGGSSFP